MSNPCMPGLVKIGQTERTPTERLQEANHPDTWRPPMPYSIEFAKKVSQPKEKEKFLHTLLETYAERVSPSHEFFRISAEEVRPFFDLMDGDMWNFTNDPITPSPSLPTVARGDLKNYFQHGQRVRHTADKTTWMAVYDSGQNRFLSNEKPYTMLSKFALAHYRERNPKYKSNANLWKECECEEGETWIPVQTYMRQISRERPR